MSNFKTMSEERIYDYSDEARYEKYLVHHWRIASGTHRCCQRCGYQTDQKDPRMQLILTRKAWDGIIERFRQETFVPQRYNSNIWLCPSCMEQLNGKPFEEEELITTQYNGKIPMGNYWYLRKYGYLK